MLSLPPLQNPSVPSYGSLENSILISPMWSLSTQAGSLPFPVFSSPSMELSTPPARPYRLAYFPFCQAHWSNILEWMLCAQHQKPPYVSSLDHLISNIPGAWVTRSSFPCYGPALSNSLHNKLPTVDILFSLLILLSWCWNPENS